MTTAQAIAELMAQYDYFRGKWIAIHGDDSDFDSWFVQKLRVFNTKEEEAAFCAARAGR
jgi:hypothetical protein